MAMLRAKRPWWEREIPSLQQELVRYVRARLPSLTDQHADLVQQTLLGLTEELRERSNLYPKAWFSATRSPDESEQGYFRALSLTILRRRIADRFVHRTREWAHEAMSSETPTASPQTEHRHLVRQIYAIMLELLQHESAEDRSLLMRTAVRGCKTSPLTARERQRLRRVRERLDSAVRARLGTGVKELLLDREVS